MKEYTVKLKWDTITGPVQLLAYADGSPAIAINGEILSINLSAYDLVPPAGHVFVKNWSDHEGLPDALVAAGVAEKRFEVNVGTFNSSAWLMKLTTDEEPVVSNEPEEGTYEWYVLQDKMYYEQVVDILNTTFGIPCAVEDGGHGFGPLIAILTPDVRISRNYEDDFGPHGIGQINILEEPFDRFPVVPETGPNATAGFIVDWLQNRDLLNE